MQTNLYELDFSEIDIQNPFSITECAISPRRKNSGLSLTDSLHFAEDTMDNADETQSDRKRNQRGRKIDDFDYKAKIQEELEKYGDEATEPSVRRRLIQKIRNRLSANRSRLRSRAEIDSIKDENKLLKKINIELQKKIEYMSQENKSLVEKLFKTEPPSPDIKPPSEDQTIIRDSVKTEKSSFKNLFLITAILLALTFLPSGADDKVKLGGAVPLLSLRKPISKAKDTTIRDFCTKNGLSEKSCLTPKRYLYKLKQRINKYKGKPSADENVPPQYKARDFMTEVVHYTCYDNDSKNHEEERVFLFDKEFLGTFNNNKGLHYVSEAWSVEDINN